MRVRIPETWYASARHDLRELHRSGRAWIASSLLALTVTLALVNGAWWVAFQREAIGTVVGLASEQDARYKADAIAYAAQHERITQGAPQHPVSVYWKRTYAWLPPAPLAVIAIGQSDVRPYYAVFHGVSPQVLHFASEIRNPLHLLIGSFDLAFVLTCVLPLILIVLSYDLVAAERDSGRMALLQVQAPSLRGIFLVRLVVRTALVGSVFCVVFAAGLAVASPESLRSLASMELLVLALLYLSMWAGVVLIVNACRWPGWLCGLLLVGIWVLVTFLVPSLLHAGIERAAPVPSRPAQVVEAAALRQRVDQDRAHYWTTLLKERPELARGGDPTRRPAQSPEWYPQFLAYQIALERAAALEEQRFTTAVVRQEQLADAWRLISPAIVMHRAATRLAGTSTGDLHSFAEEVQRFRASWLEFTRGFLFRNEYLLPEDFDRLPRYNPAGARTASASRGSFSDGLYLATLAAVLILTGRRRVR